MPKDKNYLGVDLGVSGIKMVELKNEGGRARLLTFGYSERESEGPGERKQTAEVVARELLDLYQKTGATSRQVITGLPIASVFSTLFTLPSAPDKELEEQIKAKTVKLTPIPEKDLVLDWRKVLFDESQKLVKILVTAASRDLINNYIQIFKSAGLNLMSLETEAFALIRSLMGKDKAASLIIDFGFLKTNILVVKEAVPIIARTVKAGGKDFTALLGEALGVEIKEAAEAQKSFSLTKLSGAKTLLKKFLEAAINEIQYCQNLYKEQYNQEELEKIILTGGASSLRGLGECLEEEVGRRVFVGDPWARVIYPDDLRPALDKIGPKMAVAIGLAMREIA